MVNAEQHWSAWLADGAGAEVVGEVSPGRGLVAAEHFASGQNYEATVADAGGKRWFEDGRIVWHPKDRAGLRRMVTGIPDKARDAWATVLASAQLPHTAVDFYACHQPNGWFRSVTQKCAGLTQARSLDTFPWAGTIGPANIPLVMHTARKEGLLRDGNLVGMFAGGSGETWTASLLRWGRGSRQ